jgi:hypothetical protein
LLQNIIEVRNIDLRAKMLMPDRKWEFLAYSLNLHLVKACLELW